MEFASKEIAQRYFSPQELTELRALPPKARAEGFFLCWTRKEAYRGPTLLLRFLAKAGTGNCAIGTGPP